jgi:hypothetical protein
MFLLAVLIAGCITFGAAHGSEIPWSPFWRESAFWSASLPAWLQGVGTVAAAYVAGQAFRQWRAQEREKRRAAVAEQLALKIGEFVDGIRLCRVNLRIAEVELGDWVKLLISEKKWERYVDAEARYSACRSMFPLARGYFGQEIVDQVSELRKIYDRVRGAYHELEFREKKRNDGEDIDHELYRDCGEVLGLIVILPEQLATNMMPKDELAVLIEMQYKKIVDVLEPQMTLSN